jgi:hypothetical protein
MPGRATSSCSTGTTRTARTSSSSGSTAPRPPRPRATAGSTSTSSSAIKTKPSYGWQYIYLFFRNQDEAERFGIDEDYLDTIAGGIEELNEPEWLEYLEDNSGSDGAISQKLQGYEELGRDLGIRTGQAAIVSGPGGTRTLQDGPSLAQIEVAIEAVR